MTELPSIEECHEFLATINRGRKAIGLEPIETLDFDECEPDDPKRCLSARHLFALGGAIAWAADIEAYGQPQSLVEEFGGEGRRVEIPEAILKVTDPFDDEMPGLRERLVE